jgi:type IV secretory pathway VirB2 component (pilin)
MSAPATRASAERPMSDPAIANASSPAIPEKASFWEDLIDIFYQPSAVFARRRTATAWPPYLFIVIAMAVLTIATYNSLEPAMTSDLQRVMQKTMEHNPQMTQEMADKAVEFQRKLGPYLAPIFLAFGVFIVGVFTWGISKLFSAKEDFGGAILIASYAYMPRVLGSVIAGVEGLLMDPAKLTSVSVFSVGPARFYDPATTSPFTMALLQRLDLMIIWETVLLAIGVAVIGRISRGKAIAFGILMWVVGGLYVLRSAYLIS